MQHIEDPTAEKISLAFLDNPRMNSLIGEDSKNFEKKVKIIINYCYTIAKRLNGVFISSNQKTIMLYYRKSEFNLTFTDYINYLKIALFCIGFKRLVRVFLREKQIKKLREKPQDYLYVWILTQEEGYNKLDGLLETKIFLMEKAKSLNLPILVETTEKRLLILYKRLGFDIYNHWEDNKEELNIWFAKKENHESFSYSRNKAIRI